MSSECGQALRREARLITTFERVPAGTDGGVTLGGTAAGAVAAGLVSLVGLWAGLLLDAMDVDCALRREFSGWWWIAFWARYLSGAGGLGTIA